MEYSNVKNVTKFFRVLDPWLSMFNDMNKTTQIIKNSSVTHAKNVLIQGLNSCTTSSLNIQLVLMEYSNVKSAKKFSKVPDPW